VLAEVWQSYIRVGGYSNAVIPFWGVGKMDAALSEDSQLLVSILTPYLTPRKKVFKI
jgi:hypothetical protein